MEYAILGKSSMKVSKIGLGTWQFGSAGWGWGRDYGRKEALNVINAALDMGISFIDTAHNEVLPCAHRGPVHGILGTERRWWKPFPMKASTSVDSHIKCYSTIAMVAMSRELVG